MKKTAVKILKLFDREIKGVHQAALLLGVMGILTQVLSLLRIRIIAGKFGAGVVSDVYFAAFRVPDFVFTLTLFVTAGASLIPVFIKEVSKGEESARLFLGRITAIFFIIIIPLLLAVFILTPYITRLITPGFSESDLLLLNSLTRVMLLSPLFFGLSNITSIVIQSFQKFFIYSLSPFFYNAGIIFGVLVLYPKFGNSGLAWGVALGAACHFLIQVPSLIKLKIFPKFTLKIFTADIKKSFIVGIFRTFALTLNQFVFIILTAFASIFSKGSIAIFSYSNSIQSIPLSIIGLSYSLAAFPVLSRFMANNEKSAFVENVVSAARHIIFWSVPVSVMFIVLRAQIVRSILGTGSFKWTETRLTAASLAIFAVSITAQSLILLFSRAFYAGGKTKRPLFINSLASVIIIIISFLSVLFIQKSSILDKFLTETLRLRGLTNIEVLSLPFAYSIGTVFNAALLWVYFEKDFGIINGDAAKSLRQNLAAGVVLGGISYFALNLFNVFIKNDTFFGIFLQGAFAGVCGVSAAFLILYLFKNKELNEITQSLKTKFWKTPVISEEAERLS